MGGFCAGWFRQGADVAGPRGLFVTAAGDALVVERGVDPSVILSMHGELHFCMESLETREPNWVCCGLISTGGRHSVSASQ